MAAAAAGVLPAGSVVDGELIIWDERLGRSSFTALQGRITAGRRLVGMAAAYPASLVLFDVLQLPGTELLGEPLRCGGSGCKRYWPMGRLGCRCARRPPTSKWRGGGLTT